MESTDPTMKIRGLVLAALTATTLLPRAASGQDQPWLADRRYTEGPGYRVGDYELHPGLAAEFGFDSNFYLRASSGDAPGEPVGALRLRVTPSFSFSTLGPQRKAGGGSSQSPPAVEFSGGLSGTYNEFFPVSGIPAQKEAMWGQRNFSGLADLRMNINPTRPWSGALNASLGRLFQPSQEQGALHSIFGEGYNRLTPTASAELVWNPNSGLLDWRLGYNFGATIFEADRFSSLTNLVHTFQTRGRWRFLPRSAVIYDARLGIVQYVNQGEKTGSMPLRVQLGYNGLITNNFGALLSVGWGASFYDPGSGQGAEAVQDFDSVIGQAEVRYFLTPNPSVDPAAASSTLSTVALGFTRDFYDAYIGTFFERDRGYFKLTYFLGGRFVVIVDAGAGALINPTINTGSIQTSGWTDVRVDASGFAEYRFKDAFGINTTLRYNTRVSDKTIDIPGVGVDKLGWQQFEAYLGARWLM